MESIISRAAALEETPSKVQPVSPFMHWWFLADTFLVFIAGVQLFVLSEFTNLFFAWTIKSSLTAAFLGAAYWGALPLTFNSWREKIWANARIVVPGVWVFTTLTFILTLVHLDKFNGSSPLFTAQFAFWAWLAIYALVPISLIVLWWVQSRMPGGDPPRTRPLPTWFRAVGVVQCAVLLGVGAALYFASSAMIPLWAWALTPLTSGAVGAWLIGIGVTNAQGVWENDARRLRGNFIGGVALGALQLIAVARYAGQMDWSKLAAGLYVAFVVSLLAMGAIGVYFARRTNEK